jgi:predicted transposase/invertase (TIGR01784 family)
MKNVYFPDTAQILSPCKDAIFKLIFTRETPNSRGALDSLVSAFVGRKARVLTITSNEPPVPTPANRHIRYDIACKLEDGEPANLEMTLYPRTSEAARMEYYIARLYGSQDIKGAGKGFGDLKRAYQISFFGEENLFSDPQIVHHFMYYDKTRETNLGGRTEIITVELKKAAAIIGKAAGELSLPEQWAVFFRYGPDRERRPLINRIMAAEEGIAMAGAELLTVSEDERMQAWLMSAEKYEIDRTNDLTEAQRAGLAEGYEKAKAEFQQRIQQEQEQFQQRIRQLEEEVRRLRGDSAKSL